MIKNASNLYPFAIQDQLSNGLTGQTPSVYISKDGESFAAATNSATEFNASTAPGLYTITFTATECDCDVMIIQVYLPNGQDPAILDVVEMEGTSSGLTAAEVWQYNGQEGRTVTNTIPTASDNAQAVWGAQTKEVTIATAQADTFATASSVANIATVAGAIKAKTDNLPASPAAVGSAMTLTSAAISAVQNGLATSSELSALETHGDSSWATATGFATPSDLSGLSTFNAATDTVLIDATQAATMVTATGFATPSDIPSAENIWEYPTRTITDSPDIQAELTTYGAAKTGDIPTAQDIWEYPDRELTSEISVEISDENIADITESVWNADDRTLTDLTPKPNQKSIACTPSNVINAYGIPRLENWTNETAGTQAFDNKINTYITLAKEKMATDLNDHINAAIAYIGADNITELCAWLTGYNLYQDDESTDTDSLPETRYNQYLEQIHRIMENI